MGKNSCKMANSKQYYLVKHSCVFIQSDMFQSGYQPSSSYKIYNHENAGKNPVNKTLRFLWDPTVAQYFCFTTVKLQMVDRNWRVIVGIEY